MTEQKRRMRKPAGPLQKAAGVVLFMSGMGMSLLGALLLLSALNANHADRFLSDWAVTGEEPRPAAFAIAEAAAIRTIRFYPSASGEHWDRLGRVYDWRHWQAPAGRGPLTSVRPPLEQILNHPLGADASIHPHTTRLRAMTAYEKAVAERPLWPYGVARLASARLRAGGVDQEFAELIKRAYYLGPWRPIINR